MATLASSISDATVWTEKYHCTVDLQFDWLGLVCFANKNKNCQLSYSCIQTSQTGGQRYNDTSPFSIPWFRASLTDDASVIIYDRNMFIIQEPESSPCFCVNSCYIPAVSNMTVTHCGAFAIKLFTTTITITI